MMIRLLTLGGLTVLRSKDGPYEVVAPHPKRHALLVYLAVDRPVGSHARDSLLATFWPESDEQRARNALSQLLRSIRRELGDDVLARGRGRGVSLGGDAVTCDALDFAEAVGRADHAKALELYQGDFLKAFHLAGSPSFEDWIERQATRFRLMAARACLGLADEEESRGRPAEAAQALLRSLELRPFDENAARALIGFHVRQGENAAAVAAYESFASRLERELGIGPSEETVRAAQPARVRTVVADATRVVVVEPNEEPNGVSVPKEARRWRRRLGVAGAAAAAAALATFVALPERPAISPERLEPERVFVDLFANLTGHADLDHISRLATDRLVAGLTYTPRAEVVSAPVSEGRSEEGSDTGGPRALAESMGAGTLVSGTYSLAGADLEFNVLIVDVASGDVVAAIRPVAASVDSVSVGFSTLRDRVLAEIGARVDPRLAGWSRHASRPASVEALRTFLAGLDAYMVDGDRQRGVELFRAAYASDSTFAMAALWTLAAFPGEPVRDSLLRSLHTRRAGLRELDRHFLDYVTNRNSDDRAAYEAIKRVVEIAPGSDYLGFAVSAADRAGASEEILAFARAADPRNGLLRYRDSFWNRWAAAASEIEGCEAARDVARELRDARAPGRHQLAFQIEINASICEGDWAGVADRFAEYFEATRTHGWSRLRTVERLAIVTQGSVAALGRPYQPLAELALAEIERMLEERPEDSNVWRWKGETLMSLDRLNGAQSALERSRELGPRGFFGAWATPVLLAHVDIMLGRRDRVDALLAEARAAPVYLRGADRDIAVAAVLARLGDVDEALDIAKQGWDRPGPVPFLLQAPMRFDPIADHPAFVAYRTRGS